MWETSSSAESPKLQTEKCAVSFSTLRFATTPCVAGESVGTDACALIGCCVSQWLVDLNAARLAVLSLGAISLEEQRRRLESDALEMAKYFRVNDVICCEVQKVQVRKKPLLSRQRN